MHQINHMNLRRKKWVGVNYSLHGIFSADSQIKLKTSMLRSSFWNYSDIYIYILVTRTITVTGEGADDTAKQTGERYQGVIFKNCALFIK